MAAVEPVNFNKSHEPKDSAFKQQRLPAWRPILSPGSVLPTFLVIGVAFIPIGVGMLYFSNSVMEVELDYTDCTNAAGVPCYQVLSSNVTEDCICQVSTTIDKPWEGEVYLHYGMTNFYQNHRRYVKSRDDNQLLGDLTSILSNDCEPYRQTDDKKNYIPCGAIANSLFSDVIKLFYTNDQGITTPVQLIRRGIAWKSDRDYKFRNPAIGPNETLESVLKKNGYARPKNWKIDLWELDTLDEENNGLQNEDLMVWMRTAALPNFRKLYRKFNHSAAGFEKGLPKGKFTFEIKYRFEVKQFSGTKSVIMSTVSSLGGINPFLGISYIVVGSISLCVGVSFLFIHIKFGKTTNKIMQIMTTSPF